MKINEAVMIIQKYFFEKLRQKNDNPFWRIIS